MTRKGIKTAPGDFGCVIGDKAVIDDDALILPGTLVGANMRYTGGKSIPLVRQQ